MRYLFYYSKEYTYKFIATLLNMVVPILVMEKGFGTFFTITLNSNYLNSSKIFIHFDFFYNSNILKLI